MKKKGIFFLCIVLLLIGMVAFLHEAVNHRADDRETLLTEDQHKPTQMQEPVTEDVSTELEEPEEAVSISELRAQRIDARHIKILWSDNLDTMATGYSIQKYDNRRGDHTWTSIGEKTVTEHTKGELYEYVDELDSGDPQQYVYRVVPEIKDDGRYVAAEGPVVLCSNWKICIDPGHYAGKNEVPEPDSYGYAEGDFTLQIALALKERLEKEYGITVSMTRDSGSISIDGYTDASLDSGHISLRGAYAAEQQCDLFVSIHTNANEDNANGAATFQQPVSIDKPIIIANDRMLSSQMLCAVCNQVGQNLADVSYDMGISSHKDFTEITGNNVREWTSSYNDSTDESGTVVCRHGDHGQYYGVLRGAEEAGIPGIIIEHGYHTVAEMRDAARNSDLKSKWAEADAQGIASGIGFHKLSETDR